MRRTIIRGLTVQFFLCFLCHPSMHANLAGAVTATLRIDPHGKPIKPGMFGIFFEDLNYAADDGLYAELVQNRSFEYSRGDNRRWDGLTAWDLIESGGPD